MSYVESSNVYPRYVFSSGGGGGAASSLSQMFQPEGIVIVSPELIAQYTTDQQWYDHIDSLDPSKNTISTGTFAFNATYGPRFKVTASTNSNYLTSKSDLLAASVLTFDCPRVPSEFYFSLYVPSQSYTTGGNWVAALITADESGYMLTYINSGYSTHSKVFTISSGVGTLFPANNSKTTTVSRIPSPFTGTYSDLRSKVSPEVINKPCQICFIMDKSYYWSHIGTANFLNVYISKLGFRY